MLLSIPQSSLHHFIYEILKSYSVQNTDYWRALMNAALNLWFSKQWVRIYQESSLFDNWQYKIFNQLPLFLVNSHHVYGLLYYVKVSFLLFYLLLSCLLIIFYYIKIEKKLCRKYFIDINNSMSDIKNIVIP